MSDWKKTEKEFEQFFSSFGKQAYVHRLTDTAAAKATSGNKAFVAAQPSDYLAVANGNTFFAEVKSSQSATSFSHSNIRPKQLASARRIIKAGGSYLFFVKSQVLKRWFVLPAEFIINSPAKSTKWSDISQFEWNPYELP